MDVVVLCHLAGDDDGLPIPGRQPAPRDDQRFEKVALGGRAAQHGVEPGLFDQLTFHEQTGLLREADLGCFHTFDRFCQRDDAVRSLVLVELDGRIVALASEEVIQREVEGGIETHDHEEGCAGGNEHQLREDQPSFVAEHISQRGGIVGGQETLSDRFHPTVDAGRAVTASQPVIGNRLPYSNARSLEDGRQAGE